MEITFTGYKLSQKQQDILVEASGLILKQLMSNRLKNTLRIEIKVVKNLIDKGNWGDVDVFDDYERSPKEYLIRLNYSGIKSFNKMLEVLSHELIHVAQYATRKMRILSGSFSVAYGKDHYNSLRLPYMERPWEIEAHEKEYILYSNAVNKSKNIKAYIEKTDQNWGVGL